MDIYLNDKEQRDYNIYVYEDEGKAAAYICFGKRPLTEGTYDLYWIAVDPKIHGKGIGSQLISFMESELSKVNANLVLIETSGERYLGELPRAVVKVMDIKCPGSGEGSTLNEKNLEVLDRKDEIKFVIAGEGDYAWARDFTRQRRLGDIVDTVIFSPVYGELDPKALSEWILRDALSVRLGLQLHKFIWGPDVRGV